MPIGSRYAPLTAYLAAQPPAVGSVTLTLAEVEAILGVSLPQNASKPGRTWWSNAVATPQSRAWRSVGWAAVQLRQVPGGPPAQTVTFARVVPETSV